jgi:hypothetical protein
MAATAAQSQLEIIKQMTEVVKQTLGAQQESQIAVSNRQEIHQLSASLKTVITTLNAMTQNSNYLGAAAVPQLPFPSTPVLMLGPSAQQASSSSSAGASAAAGGPSAPTPSGILHLKFDAVADKPGKPGKPDKPDDDDDDADDGQPPGPPDGAPGSDGPPGPGGAPPPPGPSDKDPSVFDGQGFTGGGGGGGGGGSGGAGDRDPMVGMGDMKAFRAKEAEKLAFQAVPADRSLRSKWRVNYLTVSQAGCGYGSRCMPWLLESERSDVEAINLVASLKMENFCAKLYI